MRVGIGISVYIGIGSFRSHLHACICYAVCILAFSEPIALIYCDNQFNYKWSTPRSSVRGNSKFPCTLALKGVKRNILMRMQMLSAVQRTREFCFPGTELQFRQIETI